MNDMELFTKRKMQKKIKIRQKILAAFSGVLFVAFLLTGIIFNVVIDRYIHYSATTHLDGIAIDNFGVVLDWSDNGQLRRRALFGPFVAPHIFAPNTFIVDADFNPLGLAGTQEELSAILRTIRDRGMDLSNLYNERIHTDDGVFYVLAQPMHYFQGTNLPEDVFRVTYLDITDLLWLARQVTIFMLILVAIMFVMAAITTLILSNSITRPLEKLGKFALGIGSGDFTPNNFVFREQELCDLNTALNKSARQLGHYDASQKVFFQNVSHELRTPLMSIQCYAEGISFGLMEPVQASETILQETDKLSDLVADLLYISKIDNITTAYDTAQADLIALIRDSAARQKSLADRANIDFEFDFGELEAMQCRCVPELISRAVGNLISNAVRHAASRVTLSCRKKAGFVEIAVADDGDGIAEDILPRVYERFCKGEGGNTGIGLSIVKSIAEQHGGRTTAHNPESGGAVFTIILPI